MSASAEETSPDVRALERVVAGRYALERELGRGGMGVVLLARDLSLDRPVAIKLLPALLAAQPVLRERFLREARTAAGLSHPNIVPIHAVEDHDDLVFIVMAFVDGETLADRVRRTGPLPALEAARILREVAWALAYAHGRGIVHRDIKPDNILIERGSGRALVTDFGIARARDGPAATERLTLEGQLLGTAAFMSPEQGAGEPVDGRSDLYALGGVGFYALTGHAPFEATTLEAILVARFTRAAPPVASVRPDVPARLAATIDRCLARQPYDRDASAEAVADALSDASGGARLADVAPPVRSFLRSAEQSVWLASLVVVFTLLYGIPTTRRVEPLVFAIVFGMTVLAIDLVRRARELLGEGFDAGDVRRGFALERQAHAEEMRQLFDARRLAANRRTRRRAWAILAIGVAARVLVQIAFMHRRELPVHPPVLLFIAAMVVCDLVNTVSLVVGFTTSQRAERRAFGLAAWLWSGRVGRAFFRAAGLGRRERVAATLQAGRAAESRLSELAPRAVVARFPDLPDLLRQLDETQTAMRVREGEVARALAEARVPADAAPHGPGVARAPTQAGRELDARRDALLAEMQEALETTRERRTTIGAALENVRVQLLRIGAGIGAPDDMHDEVSLLRSLAADRPAFPAARRPGAASPR